MTDLGLAERTPSDVRPGGVPPKLPNRYLAVFGIVASSTGVYLVLAPLGGMNGFVKVLVVLLALGTIFKSGQSLGRIRWGPDFELGYWFSLTWLVVLGLSTAFAGFLPLGEHVDVAKMLNEPVNQSPDLFSQHPFGTNSAALDILSRSIYAARVSLGIAGLAVAISLIIGVAVGMAAGYRRGLLDKVVGVLTDTSLAVPGLVILIAMAAVLGVPSSVSSAIWKEGLALALVSTPTMIRLARANTIAIADREFVTASRCLGSSNWRIMRKHLLPNVVVPLISYVFIVLAVLIVAEGSLAFLGLGLQQPEPTWGNMIAEGDLAVLKQNSFIPLVPGVFLFLTVLSFNRIGERLRSRLATVDGK